MAKAIPEQEVFQKAIHTSIDGVQLGSSHNERSRSGSTAVKNNEMCKCRGHCVRVWQQIREILDICRNYLLDRMRF